MSCLNALVTVFYDFYIQNTPFGAAAPEGPITYDSTKGNFLRCLFSVHPDSKLGLSDLERPLKPQIRPLKPSYIKFPLTAQWGPLDPNSKIIDFKLAPLVNKSGLQVPTFAQCEIIGHRLLRGHYPSCRLIPTYINLGASGTADHITLLRLFHLLLCLFLSVFSCGHATL